MDIINEYLRRTRRIKQIGSVIYWEPRPRIECKDGFTVSVQADEYSYCYPSENRVDMYEQVELEFPSAEDELINEYAKYPGDPTKTVYAYVPIDVVVELIEKHGGIVN